ncbi:response regulator, partial [Salmonella enterica]|uniref:response regulator n=1 Tax=Salmonella enterica TaxID=28901 RepID=UPI000CC81D12
STEREYAEQLDAALHVILADYRLPQFHVLRALRVLQDSGLDIPLIIITDSNNEEAAVECMKAGAADYLLKDRLARLGEATKYAIQG